MRMSDELKLSEAEARLAVVENILSIEKHIDYRRPYLMERGRLRKKIRQLTRKLEKAKCS